MLGKVRDSRFVRDVALPWLTSIAVHSLILVAGALMLRTLVVVSRLTSEAQDVLPEIELVAPEMPAGTSDVYLGRDDFDEQPAAQDVNPNVLRESGFAEREGEAFDLAETPTAREAGAASPKFLGAEMLESGGDPTKSGAPGGGRGAPQARFGPPGGGVPDGSVFRPGKPVGSVAYVCDASGSMIDKFSLLREQLDRSIAALKPVQSFNVIFFRDERAAALSDRGLLTGVAENKRRAHRFVEEVVPSGTTDPLPALELALRQKPELIYLLTDGDFPNNAAVLASIRRHNPGGRLRINTIAFVERGDGYEQVLKTIAAENGGTFVHFARE